MPDVDYGSLIVDLRTRIRAVAERLLAAKQRRRQNVIAAANGDEGAKAIIAEADAEREAMQGEGELLAEALEEAEGKFNAARDEAEREREAAKRERQQAEAHARWEGPESQLRLAKLVAAKAERRLQNTYEDERLERAKRDEIARRIGEVERGLQAAPEGSPERPGFEAKLESLRSELAWRDRRLADASAKIKTVEREYAKARRDEDVLENKATALRNARAA